MKKKPTPAESAERRAAQLREVFQNGSPEIAGMTLRKFSSTSLNICAERGVTLFSGGGGELKIRRSQVILLEDLAFGGATLGGLGGGRFLFHRRIGRTTLSFERIWIRSASLAVAAMKAVRPPRLIWRVGVLDGVAELVKGLLVAAHESDGVIGVLPVSIRGSSRRFKTSLWLMVSASEEEKVIGFSLRSQTTVRRGSPLSLPPLMGVEVALFGKLPAEQVAAATACVFGLCSGCWRREGRRLFRGA
jgi:hypothetical protein